MHSGITFKVDKCEFAKSEVSFLGHLVSKEGIKKSPEFIDKINNFPRPSTVTQLRRFLGLANFQSKFVDRFAEIAKPLTSKTAGSKRKILEWSDNMINAFHVLIG